MTDATRDSRASQPRREAEIAKWDHVADVVIVGFGGAGACAALMLAVFCFNLLGDGLRDVLDPKSDAFRGRIFKITGDGVMAAFASSVDAVQCAVDIQSALAARHAETELAGGGRSIDRSPHGRRGPDRHPR